jgi:hypothetical protein
MSTEVITVTFYVLVFVTVVLQFIMYFTRAKFLQALNKKPIVNFRKPRIEDMSTMLMLHLPVKLPPANDDQLKKLRKFAVRASTCWMISLLITLAAPIILSRFLD